MPDELIDARVLVCGVGVAGTSAALALLASGADVALTAAAESTSVPDLLAAGARWLGRVDELPDVDLVVVSPGVRPNDPLLVAAKVRGVPVWGEAELAWRLRGDDAAPWLAITGTNGKTTTVHMLEAMLRAGGLRALAVGNVGEPLIDAVLASDPYDVLAVELSSQQLHFAPSIRPAAGALLNLAPDHLDWHGSFEDYVMAKAAVWYGPMAIGNADDPLVKELLETAIGLRVPFTLDEPQPGQLGVANGHLVSRAFGDDALVLAAVGDVHPAGAHNVANALAAAALARAVHLGADAVAGGLSAFVPDAHRNQPIGTYGAVTWVDDSKATNAHAARGSLLAYDRVVWIAGGQLKGATLHELVIEVADRLAGVVLLGADRAVIAEALRRHAPDVPVIEVETHDDGAMLEVVRAAAGLARAGDTVLLAPAAASYDMFAHYGARGDAFAAAIREAHVSVLSSPSDALSRLRERLRRAPAGDRFLDRPYASVQLLLLASAGLLGFGLLMAVSTTIAASDQADGTGSVSIWAQVIKEAEFVALGIPVFWFAVRLPPRAYRALAYPALILGIAALVAVLIPGIGFAALGARRWIDIGPLQLQPSEFAKVGVLLWGGDLLARKQQLGTLRKARHLFLPLVPGFVFVILLVMLEPDLGTTLCYLLILLGLLWMVGMPLRYFAVLVTAIGGAVTALAVAEPYRLQRLTSFADPFKDKEGAGFHAVEGIYALANGGVFGVGLGQGTSKYGWVPNANSDYVFAIIGEELGLLGCLAVLALFAMFAYTGMRIARRSADPFVRLVAGAATVWLCGQAVINVGYVTGLLPVTGIPLPFISAGGTSLLATFFVLGMLVSFARHEAPAVSLARKDQRLGRRSRVQRWLRIPVPRPYQPPKRRGSRPPLRPAVASGRNQPRNQPRDGRSRDEPAARGTGRAKRGVA